MAYHKFSNKIGIVAKDFESAKICAYCHGFSISDWYFVHNKFSIIGRGYLNLVYWGEFWQHSDFWNINYVIEIHKYHKLILQ